MFILASIIAITTVTVGPATNPVKITKASYCQTKPKYFIGKVKNAKTGRPVSGAKISFSGSKKGLPPIQYTDSEGIFTFPWNGLGYVIITVDADGYGVYTRRIDPNPPRENEEFRLPPNNGPYNLQINSFKKTSINVVKGDTVLITADGTIRVGKVVKDVGPDGKRTNFGISLQKYNKVQRIREHGALIYRIGGIGSWSLCGSNKTFIAPSTGKLEFDINDKDQTDNTKTDFFNVTVSIS